MSARAAGGLGLLGLGGLAYLLLADTRMQAPYRDAGAGHAPIPGPAPATLSGDDAHDDETALARMLASEDPRNRNAQIVIGWLTRERAHRAHMSIYDFVTAGKGYGHQSGRHANTAERPTQKTRELARAILREQVRPSLAIRQHAPGSWVERQQGVSDDEIVALQQRWHEGIYARIAGTKWVLFSPKTAPIQVAPYLGARERLNALPQVPAVDPGVA